MGGGAWTVCQFKGGGGLGKKEGVVFLRRGWYPSAHYVNQSNRKRWGARLVSVIKLPHKAFLLWHHREFVLGIFVFIDYKSYWRLLGITGCQCLPIIYQCITNAYVFNKTYFILHWRNMGKTFAIGIMHC